MSIFGIIYFGLLIWAFILILNEKQKTGVLLYALYLVILPFTLILPQFFAALFNNTAGMIALIISGLMVFVFGIGLLILKIKDDKSQDENKTINFFKSKKIKLIFFTLLSLIAIHIEFFAGIETFQNKAKYFELRNHIRTAHVLPYTLNSNNYDSGNVATYSNILDIPFGGKNLYLYCGKLYYHPIPKKPYLFEDGEHPERHWEIWGQRYSYNPT